MAAADALDGGPDLDAAEFWLREARASLIKGDSARVHAACRLVQIAVNDTQNASGPPHNTGC